MSIVLCILAGVALRYALLYGRDGAKAGEPAERARWEALTRELQVRNQALHDALDQEQQAHASLRHGTTHGSGIPDDATLEELNSRIVTLEHELRNAHADCDCLSNQLADRQVQVDDERIHREGLLSQLQASNETLARLQAGHRSLAELPEALARTERELEIATSALAQEQANLETSQASLRTAEEAMARLSVDQRFLRELRDQNAQLQDQLRQMKDRLGAVMSERDAFRMRSDDALRSLENLRSELAQAEGRGFTWQRQLQLQEEELAQVRSDECELRHDRGGLQEELAAQVLRLDELTEQLEALTHENQRLRSDLASAKLAEEQLDIKDQESAKLHREIARLTMAASEQECRVREQETAWRLQQQQLRDLTVEKDELIQGLCRERDARMELEAKREEGRTQLGNVERQLTQDLERLQSRLTRQDGLLRELRIEKEEALTRLEQVSNERESLERRLRLNSEALDRLRSDSRALENLWERQTVLHHSLHEHAERLTDVAGATSLARQGGRDPGVAPKIL
ncbi:MAG TPA: hypothetical protein VIY86_05985, partial [Pirellulaceae bacterium]